MVRGRQIQRDTGGIYCQFTKRNKFQSNQSKYRREWHSDFSGKLFKIKTNKIYANCTTRSHKKWKYGMRQNFSRKWLVFFRIIFPFFYFFHCGIMRNVYGKIGQSAKLENLLVIDLDLLDFFILLHYPMFN